MSNIVNGYSCFDFIKHVTATQNIFLPESLDCINVKLLDVWNFGTTIWRVRTSGGEGGSTLNAELSAKLSMLKIWGPFKLTLNFMGKQFLSVLDR